MRTALYYPACGVALIASAAQGQAAPAPVPDAVSAPEPAHATMAPDIIVTAQKRSTSLQNVPFSIAAQTADQLRASGAGNVVELARNVAGLAVADLGPGQSQVAIRGVSSGQVARDEPSRKESVGVYLDESQISVALFTPDLDLFDISRVEVLRGPQGTLFGAGSEGGTVRYITNQPNLSRFEGSAEATAGAIDHGSNLWSAKAALNIPVVTDTLAVRATGYYDRFGGYIDAVGPSGKIDKDVNDGRKYGGRLALTFTPHPDISFTPRIVYQDLRTNGIPRADIFNIFANPYTTSVPARQLGSLEQYRQTPEGLTDHFLLADGKLDIRVGSAKLTAITSYTNRHLLAAQDGSSTTGQISSALLGLPNLAPLSAILDNRTKLHAFTQEVRIAADAAGPFQWVVGGFFLDQHRRFGQTLDVPGYAAGFNAATGAGLDGRAVNPLGSDPDVLFISRYNIKLRQYSAFGEASYDLTPEVTATAGLRYFDFKERRELRYAGLLNCSADLVNCANDPATATKRTSGKGVSPRLILAYKVTPRVTLNAQVSRGFRLGGISDPLVAGICDADQRALGNGDLSRYRNETVWNYEAGVKSRIGSRVTFNASAYYVDIRNLQVSVRLPCSTTITINVPKARTMGMEAEFAAQISDRVSFGANLSLTDGRVLSPVPLVNIMRNDRLPTSPRYQIATNVGYEAPLREDARFFANGVIQFQSSSYSFLLDQRNGGFLPVTVQYGRPSGAALALQYPTLLQSYAIGNLRAGVRSANGWEVAIFVNNVWDERAELALDRERGGDARLSYIINQPRTIGLSLRTSF